ncbi:hypothetical protein MTR_4g120200 [Medicago truncatula]|uniref:Uncharacterized protein n=1 Tax=Medicago truncatula TaxID=3880 RepID=G7JLK4_MEDTR|nr:hypothetical protein MTR_4g120200 [Medicago truncatula]
MNTQPTSAAYHKEDNGWGGEGRRGRRPVEETVRKERWWWERAKRRRNIQTEKKDGLVL